jgi:hypothetical protein
MTAREPMQATFNFSDGRPQLVIPSVVIDPTPVRRQRIFPTPIWQVDAYVGAGASGGNSLVVNLPEEPVTWDWTRWTMVAQPMDCATTLILLDGSTWTGTTHFPVAPTSGIFTGNMIAAAVLALGRLTLQQ